MDRVSKAQLNVLDTIEHLYKRKQYAPSIREIVAKSNLNSTSTVYQHMKNLHKAGYIGWEEGQPRTLKVLKKVSDEDRERLAFKFEYVY